MTSQMLPWFLVVALLGLSIGMILGVLIASALVKDHYSHILTHHSQSSLPPQPKSAAYRSYHDDC